MRNLADIESDMRAVIAELDPIQSKLSDLYRELSNDHLPSLDEEEWEWLERLEARREWKELKNWHRLEGWEGLDEWKELSQNPPPLVAWYLSGLLTEIKDHIAGFEIEFDDTHKVAEIERGFPWADGTLTELNPQEDAMAGDRDLAADAASNELKRIMTKLKQIVAELLETTDANGVDLASLDALYSSFTHLLKGLKANMAKLMNIACVLLSDKGAAADDLGHPVVIISMSAYLEVASIREANVWLESSLERLRELAEDDPELNAYITRTLRQMYATRRSSLGLERSFESLARLLEQRYGVQVGPEGRTLR